MPTRYQETINLIASIFNEFIIVFAKIVIPVFVAISIKLTIQSKKQKISFFRALLSYVIGIFSCYLAFPLILKNTNADYMPLFIGLVAISSEKIGEFLIYKFDIDSFLFNILNAIQKKIISLFK